MSQPTISMVVVVQREQALDSEAWVWTGLPQGYPGSAGGRTIAELHEEVEVGNDGADGGGIKPGVIWARGGKY